MSRTWTVYCPTGQRIAKDTVSALPTTQLDITLMQHAAAKRTPNTCPYCNAVLYASDDHLIDLGYQGVRCNNCYNDGVSQALPGVTSHGLTGYGKGCRCTVCRRAKSAAYRRTYLGAGR